MDGAEPPFDRILEEASRIVRRCKEAAGDAEPAEGPKRGQIVWLKRFCFENELYIDCQDLDLVYLDKGGENEMFYNGRSSVCKLNNFDYAGDAVSPTFTENKQILIGLRIYGSVVHLFSFFRISFLYSSTDCNF
ncbi:MAG: hypothetical protein LUF85_15355 [Bacteroides sp.]|nr:hypothetical protein [Bacteroides sp.]